MSHSLDLGHTQLSVFRSHKGEPANFSFVLPLVIIVSRLLLVLVSIHLPSSSHLCPGHAAFLVGHGITWKSTFRLRLGYLDRSQGEQATNFGKTSPHQHTIRSTPIIPLWVDTFKFPNPITAVASFVRHQGIISYISRLPQVITMSRSMRSHGRDLDNTKSRSSSSSISSFAACEARWSKLAEPADRLMRPPNKLTSTYVDRYGRTTFDDTYALGWTSTRPPPIGANHPKIIRARNNGNWSEKLEAYYSELPPNYNIPLAGQACKKPDEDWSSRSPTRVATPYGADFGPFTILLDALAKIRKPMEPTAGKKMWECRFTPKDMEKEKVRLLVVGFSSLAGQLRAHRRRRQDPIALPRYSATMASQALVIMVYRMASTQHLSPSRLGWRWAKTV